MINVLNKHWLLGECVRDQYQRSIIWHLVYRPAVTVIISEDLVPESHQGNNNKKTNGNEQKQESNDLMSTGLQQLI